MDWSYSVQRHCRFLRHSVVSILILIPDPPGRGKSAGMGTVVAGIPRGWNSELRNWSRSVPSPVSQKLHKMKVEKRAVVSTCRPTPLSFSPITHLLTFWSLGMPCMDYISTVSGIDSSSRFPFRARTHRLTDKLADATESHNHSEAITVGREIRRIGNHAIEKSFIWLSLSHMHTFCKICSKSYTVQGTVCLTIISHDWPRSYFSSKSRSNKAVEKRI